jgi:hypothetical protein
MSYNRMILKITYFKNRIQVWGLEGLSTQKNPRTPSYFFEKIPKNSTKSKKSQKIQRNPKKSKKIPKFQFHRSTKWSRIDFFRYRFQFPLLFITGLLSVCYDRHFWLEKGVISIAPSVWRCSNGVWGYCTVRPLEALSLSDDWGFIFLVAAASR